jgi:hypothetical protein
VDFIFGIAKNGAMDEQQMLTVRPLDELAALLSPRVRTAMVALNVRRGGYGDVLRQVGRSLA